MIENDAAVDPVRRVEAFEAEQVRVAGARLAAEARERDAERDRLRRELQERASEAVAVAQEALGDRAGPEAVAILAAAVLNRRHP